MCQKVPHPPPINVRARSSSRIARKCLSNSHRRGLVAVGLGLHKHVALDLSSGPCTPSYDKLDHHTGARYSVVYITVITKNSFPHALVMHVPRTFILHARPPYTPLLGPLSCNTYCTCSVPKSI